MNLTCVAQAFLNPASSRVEGYAAAVMLSFTAAVVLAPLILYAYRWRVRRWLTARIRPTL